MSRIPQNFIDDVLARTDIVDIIDKRVPLKKTGSNYSARCPFHQEKSPSFSVSERKQFYHCFGCGASGNAISFLMEHEHQTFLEALEVLANKVGLQIPRDNNAPAENDRRPLYDIMQRANLFYQQQLRTHADAEVAKDYLKKRGLTGAIAKQFQIGYAPSGWDNLREYFLEKAPHPNPPPRSSAREGTGFSNPPSLAGEGRVGAPELEELLVTSGLAIKNDQARVYDRFRERIMFPIRDRQGRVIGFGGRVLNDEQPKYLNSPETPIFHKGSELYGLYEALESNRHLEQLIVVEGYMDVIALVQQGITNVVATLGTATTAKNAERLFRQVSHVIVCFDGDTAGKTAAWRALENMLPLLEDGLRVGFMFLPQGEDPDTFVRTKGTEEFKKRINNATALSTFLFDQLSTQTDTNTLDGRSRLVKLAEPFIKQIPGKILQQLLIEELGKRTQIAPTQLAELMGMKFISISRSDVSNKNIKTESTMPTPMQQAVSMLLQYPELAQQISDASIYQTLNLKGAEVFNNLVKILHTHPQLTAAALFEHWRDTPYSQQLAKLAMRELLIPAEGLIEQFNDTLKSLAKLDLEQKLADYQTKAVNGLLTDNEKAEYARLLSNNKR
jgi:DNA primase